MRSGGATDAPDLGATANRARSSRWRTDRRIYARALSMDRPRSVTAGVLRPSPAARSSRADRGPRLRERIGGSPGSLPGRDAERFGVSAAVVLGQHLTEVAGPLGDGAVADLTARDRELGNGHGEAAGPCIAHHLYDASPVALTGALRHTHAARHVSASAWAMTGIMDRWPACARFCPGSPRRTRACCSPALRMAITTRSTAACTHVPTCAGGRWWLNWPGITRGPGISSMSCTSSATA